MLVGGFARSRYLQSQVQTWCDEVGINLKVLDSFDRQVPFPAWQSRCCQAY